MSVTNNYKTVVQVQSKLQNIIDLIGFGRYQIYMIIFCSLWLWVVTMEIYSVALISKAAYCEIADGPPQIQSYLIASPAAGAAVGALIAGQASDKLGRKLALTLFGTIVLVFGAFSALVSTYTQLIILRAFLGIGLGGAHINYTIFTENIPSKNRHVYFFCFVFLGYTSAFITSLIALGMIPKLGTKGWRYYTLVNTAPIALCLMMLYFVKESPKWFISQKQYKKAQFTVQQLAKWNKVQISEEQLDFLQVQQHSSSQNELLLKKRFNQQMRQSFQNFKHHGLELFQYLKNRKVLWTVVILELNLFTVGYSITAATLILVQIRANGRQPFLCDSSTKTVTSMRTDYTYSVYVSLVGLISFPYLIALMFVVYRKYAHAITIILAGTTFIVTAIILKPKYILRQWEGKTQTAMQFIWSVFLAAVIFTPDLIVNEVIVTRFRSRISGILLFTSNIGKLVAPFVMGRMLLNGKAPQGMGLIAALCIGAGIFMIFLPYDQKNKAIIEDQSTVKSKSHSTVGQEPNIKNQQKPQI